MEDAFENHGRLLSILPFTRGFGFAVLEKPEMLADWGTKSVQSAEDEHWVKKAKKLFKLYDPHVAVFQDFTAPDSTRSARMKSINERMIMVARDHNIKILVFSRRELMETFLLNHRRAKHAIAEVISAKFPELSSRVPPKRRQWMAEDCRMSIFEAVAMVVAANQLPFSEATNRIRF